MNCDYKALAKEQPGPIPNKMRKLYDESSCFMIDKVKFHRLK